MNFIEHSNLRGAHAILSPSSYHWLNYDEERMQQAVASSYATQRGTALHELAEDLISNHIKLTKSDRHVIQLKLAKSKIPSNVFDIPGALETLVPYVNDAIGYRMTPEVVLYYSDRCFGTTDAISYRDNCLRIHDLKTGITPAKMEQLLIYAALFSLEYRIPPKEFTCELRIYQKDAILTHTPAPSDIQDFTKIIEEKDKQVELILTNGGI